MGFKRTVRVIKMKIERVLLLRGPLMFPKALWHEEPHPPIEILYLAAVLERDYAVTVIDAQSKVDQLEPVKDGFWRLGMSDSEIKEAIKRAHPHIIGISGMWVNQKSMVDHMARLIKLVDPSIIVVVGGLLASSAPEVVLGNESIDYAILGEGEECFPALLRLIEKGEQNPEIPGVAFRSNGKVVWQPAKLIPKLDDLPMPAHHFISHADYNSGFRLGHIKNIPFSGILATRGCALGCTFCSLPAVYSRAFRCHSVQRVIAEMDYLKSRFGIKEVHFYDANLMHNPSFSKELFTEMIKRKVNLPWVPEAGLSLWELNDELLGLARESGMYRLDLPIESGSKEVLKKVMSKDLYDPRKVAGIIASARKCGVERIYGYVIIGSPGETKKDIVQTLDLLNSLDLDYKGVRYASPFPGTKFYDICKENGYLVPDFSFDRLWFNFPNIQTREFSREYLLSIVSADRAAALIRQHKVRPMQAVAEIFKTHGVMTGIRAITILLWLLFRKVQRSRLPTRGKESKN